MSHFIDRHGPAEKHWFITKQTGEVAAEAAAQVGELAPNVAAPVPFAELVCCTNFSFLRGASHADELVSGAKAMGLEALAITDWHTMAGMVRAHEAAGEAGLKLVVGVRVPLEDGPQLCLYPEDRAAYGRLCRLLTLGKRRAGKGGCELWLGDVAEWAEGMQAIVLAEPDTEVALLLRLRELFGGRLSCAVSNDLGPGSYWRAKALVQLADSAEIPVVATNDVYMHERSRKPLQDVLTCIRHGVTVQEAGGLLFPNAERRLKSGREMLELFSGRPDAIRRSLVVAEACRFSLASLRYEYPDEVTDGETMSEYLRRETWKGALARYGGEVPDRVRVLLDRELALIAELKYEAFFITIHDLVRFARSRGILCQGRGSAANSAVCYCLGITSADPAVFDLVFERFISRERAEPPDIDVDFEHERREEALQYLYQRYGRERAGLCATVIRYRTRSALRDVGKAMGLSLDQVDRLARQHRWFDGSVPTDDRVVESGLDPADRSVRLTLELARQIRKFPRHLSQHVGGMVMTQGRLDELVPIEPAAMDGRTVIEWDKDDIETLGILKVDCLALGMLTAVRRSLDLIAGHGGPRLDLAAVMNTDQGGTGESDQARAVFEMLGHADSVGTFQVESRAQMAMLPRLRPNCLFDLVVEVAIVRPGPIQGGMIHPYLRRRRGLEPVEYPHPSLIPVLEKTLGVPLFQEQAMRLAVLAAGFTPGEADQLRKAMGAWRRPGLIHQYTEKLLAGMKAKGIADTYAAQILKQIQGFGEYGFPMSHAISFALITYASSWLKRFYPAAFAAALVNSQPMGFYSVSSLVRDAREHGVSVRPVDVNASDWDCTLEGGEAGPAGLDSPPADWGKRGPAIRLGMRQVKSMPRVAADRMLAERAKGGAFFSLADVVRRLERASVGDSRTIRVGLAALARADGFASLGVSRRDALWHLLGTSRSAPAAFAGTSPTERPVAFKALGECESMVLDYRSTGLSLKAHPIQFLRDDLAAKGVITCRELSETAHGVYASVGGWILVRQRPGEGKMLFFTLEDETGIANLVVTPTMFERHRQVALSPEPIIAVGRVERDGEVVHLKVGQLRRASAAMPKRGTTATAKRDTNSDQGQLFVTPPSRDFF